MNQIRRTTVAARADDLDALEAEAERRGVSLTAVLAEAVADKAASLRAGRAPRVGVARSSDGAAARDVTSHPVAEAPR